MDPSAGAGATNGSAYAHAMDLETGLWTRRSTNATTALNAFSLSEDHRAGCYDPILNRYYTFRSFQNGNSAIYLDGNDFTFTDELYCCPIFEDEVVPLMRADADFDPGRFISTYEHVLVGEQAAPTSVGHPPPSNLIAWATVGGRSPIVYIQPGDSATTFAIPEYRRLLTNAIEWVASPAAHDWATANPVAIN